MDKRAIREAIARQKPGWSLEQQFYTSPELYEFERRGWLGEQWYVLAHCSEIPDPGSFIVRNLLNESIIIARDAQGTLRGFYNVCRHRGSRICDGDGKASSLVCPYHAWSYRLDGSLRSAPAMNGIETAALGLRTVGIRDIGGVILGSLTGNPSSLDEAHRQADPVLRYYGIRDARIAARRSYPTHGNWKLVMENFAECYHCFPAHPEYCSVMRHVDTLAKQATPQVALAWQEEEQRWMREQANPDLAVKLWAPAEPAEPAAAQDADYVTRMLIGAGRKTQSQDGEPVAPLMGQQRRYDGGVTAVTVKPFVFVNMSNDHALMFQFLPTGAETTDVVISWLVGGSAAETQVDVERMVWMWDVTTVQDKTIIERNAGGVRSLAYVPGPYSTQLEPGSAEMVRSYLDGLSLRCGDTPSLT